MTNLGRKKILWIGLSFFFLSPNVLSQTGKKLLVPYRSQQTNFWCYAACIEMTLDFWSDEADLTTQCDIVKRHLWDVDQGLYTAKNITKTTPCCYRCNNGCGIGGGNCNVFNPTTPLSDIPIPFTSEASGVSEPDYYDLLFDFFGFTSKQVVKRALRPMSWNRVKREIDNCRPFILNLASTENLSDTTNRDHVVLAVGYQEDELAGTKGIWTMDPWFACCNNTPNEAYFPFDVISTTSQIVITPPIGGPFYVNRVLSIVHSIHPDTLADMDICNTCEFLDSVVYGNRDDFMIDIPPQTEQDDIPMDSTARMSQNNNESILLQALTENPEFVAGYPKNIINEDEYSELTNSDIFFHAPVQYISKSKLSPSSFWKWLFPPNKLNDVIISGYEITDVVSANFDQEIVSTLQKDVTGKWHLRGIFTYTNLKPMMQVTIKGSDENYVLSNSSSATNPSGENNSRNFVLIKNRPEQHEFFSFKPNPNSRVNYMVPAASYPDLGLEQGIAYKENEVIKAIRKQAKSIQKTRTTFLKGKGLKK